MSADFGISSTPVHLLDKSGSAAAMLEHGLPIIVNNVPPEYREYQNKLTNPHQYILLDEFFEENIGYYHFTDKRKSCDQLTKTANQFLADTFD